MISVGLAEINITPDRPLRVAGMLNPPVVSEAVWPLYARAFVMGDGSQQAAVITIDNLMLDTFLVPELRQAAVQGTGLAPEQVMLACTHTHRAPYTAAIMDEEIDFAYVDFLAGCLGQVTRQALAERRWIHLLAARTDAPGWTFNRRQMYRSDRYGVQVGTQGPQQYPGFLGNEGPEDNELKVLRVQGEDGCGLGGLVNFACHTTVMGGEPVYSADFAGALTEQLSSRLGGVFGFLQGAAGNLWSIDTSQETGRLAADYVGPAHAARMGEALAGSAIAALKNGVDVSGPVRMASRVLAIPQRRVTREQVKLAQWYLEQPHEDLNQQEFTRQICDRDYTFFNNDPVVQEWFARETIGMWEWQRRAGPGELVEQVEIQVIAIGSLALVGLPGEIFTEFGLQIKSSSPFEETWVVELANGWHGYIPTQTAFQHGGYEPRLGYTSRLVPQAGEWMTEAALELLSILWKEQAA